MKNKKYLFLIIMITAIVIQGIYVISAELTLSIYQKLILIMIQFISIMIFSYLQASSLDEKGKNQWLNYGHMIVFMIYIFNLLYVLLFDPDFGRQAQYLADYENINLEFMKTIQLFIRGYQLGVLSIERILVNLLGNIFIFMPMAYFLPLYFKKKRKWYVFFITIACMVMCVEVIQVFLKSGAGDIDDWFLNVIGAILFYGVLKLFPIQKIYRMLGRE